MLLFLALALAPQPPELLFFTSDRCTFCEKQKVIFKKPGVVTTMKGYTFVEKKTEAQKYDVRAFPTLIIMKDGKEVKRHEGYLTEPQLLKFLE